LVGDTGSSDAKVLARYDVCGPDTSVQRGLKYHFSRCNNAVARSAECETLLFLNNDVIFPDDRTPVLDMYDALQADKKRGVVGCCLYYEDGRVQHIGVDFAREPSIRGLCYHPKVRSRIEPSALKQSWQVPAVTGACLMIRHALFLQMGMDEDYAAECQDIALCLNVDRLGYEIHIVNAGRVLHLENATRPKGEEFWPDRQRFLRRWGSYIEARYQ
jgi:GT2 family glycosyltransferase